MQARVRFCSFRAEHMRVETTVFTFNFSFIFFFTETKLIGDSHHGFALLLHTASSCKFVSGFSIGLVSYKIKIVLFFAEIYRVEILRRNK